MTPFRIYILGEPMDAAALVRWALAAPNNQGGPRGQEDTEAGSQAEACPQGRQGLQVAAAPVP